MLKFLGDCILNNTIRAGTLEDWELVNGDFDQEIYQDYIISEYGYRFLVDHTDEPVFYNERLDVYIWGIAHYGTAWSHVLTDIGLIMN